MTAEAKQLTFNRKEYGLSGISYLASKRQLAQMLGGSPHLPRSFILDNPIDLQQLQALHKAGDLYILKNYRQRQEGLEITGDLEHVLAQTKAGTYQVCQRLLQNPYVWSGRKINFRVYLLLHMVRGRCEFFYYPDGFVYYTPELFERGNPSADVNITTGYIDRKVYEDNPLTVGDMLTALGHERSHLLKVNIYRLFLELKARYAALFEYANKEEDGLRFEILGADLAPDEHLGVSLMEINMGPDLEAKDERDRALKHGMVIDAARRVGLLGPDGSASRFIHIA